MPKPATPETLHAVRATLRQVKPPIYRDLVLRGSLTLAKLHEVLQAAFSWCEEHLHRFEAPGERRIGDTSFDPEPGDEDERKVRVRDVLPARGASITYLYDFGDGWEVQVKVVRVAEVPAGTGRVPAAILVGGARAAPPEDCGGVPGYEDLCAAMADANHPDREDLIEWLGGEAFDPEEFPGERILGRLSAIR